MPTMSANIMSKQIRTTQLLLTSLSYLKKYMHGQIQQLLAFLFVLFGDHGSNKQYDSVEGLKAK